MNLHVPNMRRYGPPPLDKLLFYANEFHEEILLYYCKVETTQLGCFYFIDVSEETSSPEEWKALIAGRDELLDDIKRWNAHIRQNIKAKHEELGIEPPQNDEETSFGAVVDDEEIPDIRLVALVINGVRLEEIIRRRETVVQVNG